MVVEGLIQVPDVTLIASPCCSDGDVPASSLGFSEDYYNAFALNLTFIQKCPQNSHRTHENSAQFPYPFHTHTNGNSRGNSHTHGSPGIHPPLPIIKRRLSVFVKTPWPFCFLIYSLWSPCANKTTTRSTVKNIRRD